jgi:starch phosphorylase
MYYFLPRALPEGLGALTELALDLRWTWSHAGDALWRKLDPVFQQELARAVEERGR